MNPENGRRLSRDFKWVSSVPARKSQNITAHIQQDNSEAGVSGAVRENADRGDFTAPLVGATESSISARRLETSGISISMYGGISLCE